MTRKICQQTDFEIDDLPSECDEITCLVHYQYETTKEIPDITDYETCEIPNEKVNEVFCVCSKCCTVLKSIMCGIRILQS